MRPKIVLGLLAVLLAAAGAEGQTIYVEITRDDKKPQTPSWPYPYDEDEVHFNNKTAKVTIAGTLTKPKTAGPHRAVILVSGGGPQSRDGGVSPNHQPYLVLADHLSRNGILVLRFDKRGVGRSTGDFKTATTADFAEDVAEALEFLKRRPDVDADRIGIVGHCEGALVASMVAAKSQSVAFVGLLACPGQKGDAFYESLYCRMSRESGLTNEMAAKEIAYQLTIIALAKMLDRTYAKKQIAEYMARQGYNIADPRVAPYYDDHVSDWLHYYVNYDPVPALRQLRCPVLVLQGDKDAIVHEKEDFDLVTQALRDGACPALTAKKFPGLNHLFQTCRTGAMSEIAEIEETMAPAVLNAISEWITKQGKRKRD